MTMYAVLVLNGKGTSARLNYHQFKHFVDTAPASVIAPTFSEPVLRALTEMSTMCARAEAFVKAGGHLDPDLDPLDEDVIDVGVPPPGDVTIQPEQFVEFLSIVLDRMFRVYGEFREDVTAARHRGEFVEKVNTAEITFYSKMLNLFSAANNQALDELEEAKRPDEPDEIPRSRRHRHNPISVSIEDV